MSCLLVLVLMLVIVVLRCVVCLCVCCFCYALWLTFLLSPSRHLALSPLVARKTESKDGARLLCLADGHIGSDIDTLVSHSMFSHAVEPAAPPPVPPSQRGAAPGFKPKPPTIDFGTRFSKTVTSKLCAVAGTVDGALGVFMPVDEKLYRRLALLQQLLSTAVQTCCNLSPQEFRLFRSRRVRTERKKGLLDGALLWQFINLDAALQDDLAAAMGVTTDLLLDSLHEADLATGFF